MLDQMHNNDTCKDIVDVMTKQLVANQSVVTAGKFGIRANPKHSRQREATVLEDGADGSPHILEGGLAILIIIQHLERFSCMLGI